MLQCLKRLPDESRADETLVVSLWRHEMERIIRDRLCRHADCLWFDDTMQDVLKEVSASVCSYLMLPTAAYVFELM